MSLFSQLGPNIKELFRLMDDFVDVIGLRMKEFQDMYEDTDNLGQPFLYTSCLFIKTHFPFAVSLSLMTESCWGK